MRSWKTFSSFQKQLIVIISMKLSCKCTLIYIYITVWKDKVPTPNVIPLHFNPLATTPLSLRTCVPYVDISNHASQQASMHHSLRERTYQKLKTLIWNEKIISKRDVLHCNLRRECGFTELDICSSFLQHSSSSNWKSAVSGSMERIQ